MSLTPDVIVKYREGPLAAGKSANTVRLELALLSNLYTVAMREWRMSLNHGEGELLLKWCDEHSNPMLGWMARAASCTAMRPGEIGSLRARQVDPRTRVIRLTQAKDGTARAGPGW